MDDRKDRLYAECPKGHSAAIFALWASDMHFWCAICAFCTRYVRVANAGKYHLASSEVRYIATAKRLYRILH